MKRFLTLIAAPPHWRAAFAYLRTRGSAGAAQPSPATQPPYAVDRPTTQSDPAATAIRATSRARARCWRPCGPRLVGAGRAGIQECGEWFSVTRTPRRISSSVPDLNSKVTGAVHHLRAAFTSLNPNANAKAYSSRPMNRRAATLRRHMC